jgi:hypothetical protein
MKATRTLTLAAFCAVVVALAIPASGAAATVTPFHGSDSGQFSICGLDLNFDFSFGGVVVVKPSGVVLDPNHFTSVWANPASGKSITIHAGQLGTTSAPIDNGDGTVSFVQSGDGSYIVKATNGAPITLQAGRLTALATFDATTGAFISVQFLSVDGPHGPSADGDCSSIVAALT